MGIVSKRCCDRSASSLAFPLGGQICCGLASPYRRIGLRRRDWAGRFNGGQPEIRQAFPWLWLLGLFGGRLGHSRLLLPEDEHSQEEEENEPDSSHGYRDVEEYGG